MTISVTEPFSRAIERTTKILFRPFDLSKWLTLGFCAWLATLGEGSSGSGRGAFDDQHWDSDQFETGREWVVENAVTVGIIGGSIVLLILLLSALFVWLRCRGRFMFIDGIVRNRGAVVEPWNSQCEAANRVFLFELLLTLGGLFITALVVTGAIWISWPDIEAGHFEGAAVSGLIFGGISLFITWLGFGLVSWVLTNFIVPAMYRHGGTVSDGWNLVREEIFADQTGAIVLYFFMRVFLALCIGTLAILVTCLTCCIAAIPYVGTVILLPLFVFSRCYNLSFLEQFGERWRFYQFSLAGEEEPPTSDDSWEPN
jgi:hypothetical protein